MNRIIGNVHYSDVVGGLASHVFSLFRMQILNKSSLILFSGDILISLLIRGLPYLVAPKIL